MAKPSIDQLEMAARTALDAFVATGVAYYGDNTDEKITDLVSALRHLAERCGANWRNLMANADRLYEGDKE